MTAETPDPGKDDLQFDSAEATGTTSAGACALCHQPITTYYYEAGGQVVCSSCKSKVEASNVSGVAAGHFLRAGFFGFLGALAGAAVYYAVLATTGYEIGLIAIVVGFMVGYAVRRGAGGRGGRRYQLLALGLTYLAIGSTYVPIVMRELSDDSTTVSDSTQTAGDSIPSAAAPGAPVTPAGVAADSAGAAPTAGQFMIGVAALVLLAAAMPILVVIGGLPGSLISALIYGFALHQAWRMNGRAKIAFSGPFKVGVAPAPGGAAGA